MQPRPLAPVEPVAAPPAAASLAQRLSHPTAALSHPEGLRLFRALARELDSLHRQGHVHGHLHPHRIRLDARNQPSIVQLTSTERPVFGTPHYTSPEQVRQEAPTAASDRYAFAAMVYQWLAHRRPFEGNKPQDILQQHLFTQVPTAPIQALPERVHQVLLRGLAKDPGDRWPTAQAMMDALTEPLMVQLAAALIAVEPPGLSVEDTTSIRWGARLFVAVVAIGLMAWYLLSSDLLG